MPELAVEFFAFVNINNTIRLREGKLFVRLSDLLEGAPDTVLQAIAHILLAKMYRRPIERGYATRYRRYISGQDITRKAHLVRQVRGRKRIESAQGRTYNLEDIFDDLNTRFFYGLLARPRMTWSRDPARNRLGHWLCCGIHRLSRDAAPETSGEIARCPPMRAFDRVPG
jgi:hypothetical protein